MKGRPRLTIKSRILEMEFDSMTCVMLGSILAVQHGGLAMKMSSSLSSEHLPCQNADNSLGPWRIHHRMAKRVGRIEKCVWCAWRKGSCEKRGNFKHAEALLKWMNR